MIGRQKSAAADAALHATGRARAGWSRGAYAATLLCAYLSVLIANLPGHLTLDSLLELYEGRYRIRQSWAPSFYAWVLGAFDSVWRGAGLYVAASALLLFAALASLAWLRPRARPGAVVLAALFGLSPLLLIYQAIVWKDVLFADAAVAGMACLAWALQRWEAPRLRWACLAAALLLLAAAALLRQNGIVVGLLAAGALGWARGRDGRRRGLAWALAALAAVLLLSHGLDLATRPPDARADSGVGDGVRVVEGYDLMGAVSRDPSFPLPAATKAAPAAAAELRRLAPRYYSAERIDFLDDQPRLQAALDAIPDAALAADWRNLVMHPATYLRERAQVFRWVLLTPQIKRCVPVSLGVDGPPDTLRALGMSRRWSAQDQRLEVYDRAAAPVHAHLAYAVIAALVGLLMLRRGEPADLAMAALMASALLFAASFFVISIACDYRYLYFLDLAAMAGLLYLAIDPPPIRMSSRVQPTSSRISFWSSQSR